MMVFRKVQMINKLALTMQDESVRLTVILADKSYIFRSCIGKGTNVDMHFSNIFRYYKNEFPLIVNIITH